MLLVDLTISILSFTENLVHATHMVPFIGLTATGNDFLRQITMDIFRVLLVHCTAVIRVLATPRLPTRVIHKGVTHHTDPMAHKSLNLVKQQNKLI